MHELLIAAAAALLLAAGGSRWLFRRRRPPGLIFANIAEGTHSGSLTRRTDAAITTRHLLYKAGSDADHIAVTDAVTPALGAVADEAAGAEEYVTVDLLGAGTTLRLVASEAMASTGVDVFQAAGGKIALSGTLKVGTLLQTAAADGDVVEVSTCVPQRTAQGLVVAATRTLAASESGATIFFGHSTEFAMTLPAPFLGARFRFVCTAAPSGASYTIVTAGSANIIKGHVLSADLNAASDGDTETSGADTITFVDAKAVAGDWVEVESDGTTWFARAGCAAFDAITYTTAS